MLSSNLNETLVDSAIWVLWTILNGVDFALVALKAIFSKSRTPSNAGNNKPRVVIVGASFAGLTTLRELSHSSDELDITIIDYKTYFEYTPGVLRCFVTPSYLKELTSPLSLLQKTGARVIRGEVVNVEARDSSTGMNQVTLKDGRKIPYDYLVLAAGSTYPTPIKATPAEATLQKRQEQWNNAAAELERAQTVAIIGAGAVGVELAGEIRDKFPAGTKRVLLIDMARTILPGMEPSSVQYATRFLKDNDVELYLGSPLKKIDSKFIQFQEGTKIQVDLVYKCVGVEPNSSMLQSSGGSLTKTLVGPKKSVVVNNYFQVVGFPQVFCAGDLSYHGNSNELKLAHTAQLNAELVAKNIIRMVSMRGAL